MIKRILFFVFLLSISFSALGGWAYAQEEEEQSAAVAIENIEIKTNGGKTEISAVLFNSDLKAETTPITPLLLLTSLDEMVKSEETDYTPPPLIVSAQEGEEYFSLKAGERKPVRYFLPVSPYLPVANYALDFRLIRKDGYIAGQNEKILRDFGFNQKKAGQNAYNRGFLVFYQESCVILNVKGEKFESNEGPVFEPSERPKAKCLIKNIGDEDVVVYPKKEWKEFFVYGRPSVGTKLEEKASVGLAFKKGETKLAEFYLPAAKKPQVYQALLSFEDANGAKISFNMPFRWTIGGQSARVEKVSLVSPIKNIYQKGETVFLSVDYFGSMDLYWNNSSDRLAGLSGVKLSAAIKDENGEICGQKESDLPNINDSGRKNKIMDIVLDKKCEKASYLASISSGGEKLAEETAELPKAAESKIMKNYYYAIAAILFLALFALIKKRKKAIGPIAMLFLAVTAFGLFFNHASAATKTYDKVADYSGYGGKVGEDSAPMYSFYGVDNSNNVNKLVVTRTEAGLDETLSEFPATVYYGAGYTSCSNSTMQIRYEMYIEADGLSKTAVNFATKSSWNSGSANYKSKQIVEFSSSVYAYGDEKDAFYIDPAYLKQFYDANDNKRANPKLIIKIVQSGKSTHGGTSYHRGYFSALDKTNYSSRTAAFDASDIIRYKISLNLPDLKKDSYPLTVNKNGDGSGRLDILEISPSGTVKKGDPINFDSTESQSASRGPYESGAKVELTASGDDFKEWDNTGCNSISTDKKTCFVTMSSAKTATVTFNKPSSNTLLVSCSANPNPVALNTPTTFTATVSGVTGSYFYSWIGDDGLSGSGQSITKSYSSKGWKNATINIKDSNGNLLGTNVCGVTVSDGPNGGCTTTCCVSGCGGTDQCGSANNTCASGALSDTADSSTQYLWSCGIASCALDISTIIINPPVNFILTVGTEGTGEGMVSGNDGINCNKGKGICSVSFLKETIVTVKAFATNNSVFNAWDTIGSCNKKGESCDIIMDSDKNVVANFSCSGGIGVKCDPDGDGTTGGGGGGGEGEEPPLLSTPTLFLSNALCGQVVLSWNDVTDEIRYEIKRKITDMGTDIDTDFVLVASLPANATSYNDSKFSDYYDFGYDVSYKLTAYYNNGESRSNTATIVVPNSCDGSFTPLITPSDFSLSSSEPFQALIIDNLPANSNKISITVSGSPSGNVDLVADLSSLPDGAVYKFEPNSLQIGKSTFKVTSIPGSTKAGTYTIPIIGTDSDGTSKTINISLKIETINTEWKEF